MFIKDTLKDRFWWSKTLFYTTILMFLGGIERGQWHEMV